jgi:hypothetical protein
MGIGFRGAELQLDLLYRRGKYENGFMHGPGPCYFEDGKFHPARINFTAVAHPEETGGGHRALETLLHEGGHAAHFSNILMPGACFSQEFAPTSVALAETQSMLMDAFLDDPAWLARYARNLSGSPMTGNLITEIVTEKHRLLPMDFRSLLAVPFAEKAIYELPDGSLTPGKIKAVVREAEKRLFLGQESPRPVLSVPHLLAGESSAYYHAYLLAWLGVFQVREYFHDRYGYMTDNPRIGPELEEKAWSYGNSRNFPEMIRCLTGRDFSPDAAVREVNMSKEEALETARKTIRTMEEKAAPVEKTALGARIRMVHGDTLLADNSENFERMCSDYRKYLDSLKKQNRSQ